jgi:hypothetical protein
MFPAADLTFVIFGIWVVLGGELLSPACKFHLEKKAGSEMKYVVGFSGSGGRGAGARLSPGA